MVFGVTTTTTEAEGVEGGRGVDCLSVNHEKNPTDLDLRCEKSCDTPEGSFVIAVGGGCDTNGPVPDNVDEDDEETGAEEEEEEEEE